MSNEPVNQMQTQIENTVARPARNYASVMLDHFEQLANLQFEATKAYAETSMQQARAALEVKDSSDVRAYMENQQKVAKEMGERIKGDMEKVASLNQAFAQNAQSVTRDSAEKASKAVQADSEKDTQDNTQKESKAAKESSKKDTQAG
ncbi:MULTISPECIES: phasin family protein [unclassified Halorhodospira]|uniref:phasin family protein n=1 Tax=unclassified Halorhodospira TaxID=2626748 RepID=UPI001EE7E4FC|nr:MULTISPECIES: phasin family protein [unclassified Halorhodospira]MCG5541889.1 phasin family protein [Halorhodospira sp. M39old]MCG5546954.1 phasin family protein [Halorhodospira sp. M38]